MTIGGGYKQCELYANSMHIESARSGLGHDDFCNRKRDEGTPMPTSFLPLPCMPMGISIISHIHSLSSPWRQHTLPNSSNRKKSHQHFPVNFFLFDTHALPPIPYPATTMYSTNASSTAIATPKLATARVFSFRPHLPGWARKLKVLLVLDRLIHWIMPYCRYNSLSHTTPLNTPHSVWLVSRV